MHDHNVSDDDNQKTVSSYVPGDFDPRRLDPTYVVKREDVIKRRRREVLLVIGSILQGLTLLGFVALFIFVVFEHHDPEPLLPPPDQWTQRDGFVSLSYGGIARTEKRGERSVSRELFEKHISALMEAGYNIITTEDIIDYYWNDRPLPDRALYLMFEGGRKDSAILGQRTIKKHNLRVSMYIQTARLTGSNRFFIRSTELGVLAQNPYWDIGSQGYELRYINVMEDGGYGFFLTDYLRDRYRNPIETDDELRARLEEDYELSYEPIVRYAEREPKSYVFMPANMLWRSLEGVVEETNARLLNKYYKIVFAREGPCYNSRETAAFNLTRMQVSSEWSVNRLLAEIEASSPNRHVYEQADEEQRVLWQTEAGALSSNEESLILTAPADGPALTWLLGSNTWDNVDLAVNFTGAARGAQRIFLRYASSQSNVCVILERNNLVVEERVPQRGTSILFETRLDFNQVPERLRLTLIGNRLAIRYGADETPLTADSIPVARSIQRGRVALGALGEDEPYDAVFDELNIRPIEHRWVSPIPGETITDQGDNIFTCVLIPTASDDVRWQENGPRTLYQAVADGKMPFAELPRGNFDMWALDKPWERLPAGIFPRFISGVMVTPADDPDWAAVETASAFVRDQGLDFAVRLSKDAAANLAATEEYPGIDWIVLDFTDPLSADVDLQLRVKYDQRRFLKKESGATEAKTVYKWIGEDHR